MQIRKKKLSNIIRFGISFTGFYQYNILHGVFFFCAVRVRVLAVVAPLPLAALSPTGRALLVGGGDVAIVHRMHALAGIVVEDRVLLLDRGLPVPSLVVREFPRVALDGAIRLLPGRGAARRRVRRRVLMRSSFV